jgi:hypothetical protein
MKKLLFTLITGMVLVGCSEKINSIDYYVAHEEEAEAEQIKCKKMEGKDIRTEPNCYNAMRAMSQITQSKMQKSMSKGGW